MEGHHQFQTALVASQTEDLQPFPVINQHKCTTPLVARGEHTKPNFDMVHWRELQSITCKFHELGIIYNHLHFQLPRNDCFTNKCLFVRLCAYNRERKREKGIQVFSLLLVGPSRLFWEPVINYINKLMIQKMKNKLFNENLIDTTFQNTSDNNSTNSNIYKCS